MVTFKAELCVIVLDECVVSTQLLVFGTSGKLGYFKYYGPVIYRFPYRGANEFLV